MAIMSSRIAWMSLALALLATATAARYMRVAAGHHGPQTTAITIVPAELNRNAGQLPETKIDTPY
jgi:hypothetical protein